MTRRNIRYASTREYPRTARLNKLVREIVAEEIERIDDERLGFLTVVAVEVEADLHRATVLFTTLEDLAAESVVAEVLDEHRPRIQAAIGRQARLKRTPELVFQPDLVSRHAERVETILRDIDDGDDGDEKGSDGGGDRPGRQAD